uniref:Uncharacterized protein n=1 Tax=Rhizophora mucronata TaxID=61149 RepID=A0A2P2M1T0_RHIMU
MKREISLGQMSTNPSCTFYFCEVT